MANKSITTLTLEQEKYWSVIKMVAMKQQPYISQAFLRLVPVNAPGFGSAAVDDSWRCYIDFEKFMSEGYEYGAGILAHEPWHLLRQHSKRGQQVSAVTDEELHLWNVAGDLEINNDIQDIIPAEGLMPGEGDYVAFPRNRSAEEYYYKLLEQKDNPPEPESESQPEKSGQDQPPSDAGGQSSGQSDKQTAHNNCGSGSGGQTLEDYELTVDEAPAISEMEANLIRKSVAKSVKDGAAKQESGIDTLSQSLILWAEETLAHKPLNWKTIFAKSLRTALKSQSGQQDYVKNLPARRQPIPGILLPALRSPAPRVGVGMDTSNSNLEKLGVLTEEVMGIIKKTGVRGRDLLTFSVAEEVKSKPGAVSKKSDISFTGAGGTELNSAFSYVASHLSRKIDVFVLLTDGEYVDWLTRKPAKARHVSFIVGIIVDRKAEPETSEWIIENAQEKLSSWCKVVIIDISEKETR